MRLRSWKRPLAGGLVICAGLLTLPTTNGQESEDHDVLIEGQDPGPPGIERKPLDVMKLRVDAVPGTEGPRRRVIAFHSGPEDSHEIRAAAAAVHNAEDEKSKRQAQDRLEDLLDRYFDNDIRRRERELEDIEQRLKKLEAALERRREKRNEIVDLQVKVLLNEADGLGFFSGDTLFTGPRGEGSFEFKAEPFAAPAMVPHPPGTVIYAPQPPRAPAPARATVELQLDGPRERERERGRQRERDDERERERGNDRYRDRERAF
jgi:hypothetical protein